jgi:PAS domain S-box-containing protein
MENISRLKLTKTSNELLAILILGFIFTAIASNYNLIEFIVTFVRGYDKGEIRELLIIMAFIGFGAGIFSFGRWIEFEKTLNLCRVAENDMNERNKIYRSLFEKASEAIIIGDEKKIININKKGCEIFGLKQESPCNLSLISLIPEKYLSEFQQTLNETLRKNFSSFELKYTKPDGNIMDMEISLSLVDREDNIVQIIARDITDRKKARKREQEGKERLKTIFDNTFCGIFLIEASTRKIVGANSVALKATGYSEKELMGKALQELICKIGNERFASSLNSAGDLSEGMLFRQRGDSIPVLRSIVPVSIGEKAYFVESFVDLPEFKKTEDFFQTKTELEGANYT